MVLVLAVVWLGSHYPGSTAGVSGYLARPGTSSGQVLETSAAAVAAATVAAKTQLSIAPEVQRTATHLKSQVNLPTSGNGFLAKRAAVTTAGTATRDIRTYAVTNGDTLSGIASKFGITTGTVKGANDLNDDQLLKPGQQLAILPVSGLIHTVSPGETADSLAAKFQSNAAQIISYNNAELKGLQPGQKIIVPDGVKAEPRPVVQTTLATSRSSRALPALTRYAFSGNGYSYGYCTYYVASRRAVPAFWGNANSWYYNAQASGFGVGRAPRPGAIAWTGAGYAGHVALVESVSGGSVTISEMNYGGNWGRVTRRSAPASAFRYIY